MSVALRGSLEDFEIGDVFQLIAQQRKTGVLELALSGETIRLFFDAGFVVCGWPVRATEHGALAEFLGRCGWLSHDVLEELAETSRTRGTPLPRRIVEEGLLAPETLADAIDLLTQETVFSLLRRRKGSFDFSGGDVEVFELPVTRLGAEQILMDGLRMVDEWRAFAGQVPSEQLVFQRVREFSQHRSDAHGAMSDRVEAAERVYRLVDGRLTARRVIDLSRLGTFAGTRLMADLRQTGVIEPLEVQETAPRPTGGAAVPGLALRWIAQTALPMALCGIALLTAVARLSGGDAGMALEPAPLEQVRSAYQTLRVRNALDAERLARGSWPEDLGALAQRGLLPASALTGSDGHPYYYRRRADGAVLLAPDRELGPREHAAR